MSLATTDLMNFRIPKNLREDFRNLCKCNHTTMSSQLNSMIRRYIENESNHHKEYSQKISHLRKVVKSRLEDRQVDSGTDTPVSFFSSSEW